MLKPIRMLETGAGALVIAAMLAAGASGGVARASIPKAKVTQIAIAAPEKASDYGWNQQGVRAARSVARQFHAKLVVNDGIGYNNTEAVLRRLATSGASFIIAQASGYSTIAPRIARQYHVPIICYDTPSNLIKGSMADIETASQQGSYLAGVLAAKYTKTGTLGIVISAGDVNWFKQSGGFIAGARSVKRHVKFLFSQIGPAAYDDAPGGKRVAQAVIAGGADVVFGMGDGASFGYLNAAENAHAGHKVWFIDVIGNKTPIDKHHVLLSSVMWNFVPVFRQAVRDINNGTYGTHDYYLTDKSGISLLHSRYITSRVWHLIERDRSRIAHGRILIPQLTTEAQVRALIKR
ncbi:MAG: BMP family ABC transporter substrate-binding protein [Chloroflexota bacterium]